MNIHDNASSRAAHLAGWVLLLLPLVLAALFLFSAYRNGSFERKYAYMLLAPSAENIKPGTPLEFSGFPVGSVAAVRLDRSGLAEVTLDVSERHAQWLRSDSTFLLQQPLLGSPKIVVRTPDLRSPILPVGATRRLQSRNVTEELLAQVQPILADLKTLSATLADPAGPVRQALSHVEKVSSRMANHGVVSGLTADPGTAVEIDRIAKETRLALQKLNSAMEKADARVFAREGLADQAQAGLGETVKSLVALREGLQGVTRVVASAEKIAGNVASSTEGLPEMRSEVDAALRHTNEILIRVERMIGAQAREPGLP